LLRKNKNVYKVEREERVDKKEKGEWRRGD
jgi:hypothetical protein